MASLIIKKKPKFSNVKKSLLIVVNTKVSKKATVRNLLKRRIRAIMRPFLKNDNQNNYVIIVKPEAVKLSYQDLKKEILEKLEKIVKINNN